MLSIFHSTRPIHWRRGIAIAAVLGVVSALSLPAAAQADPITVYQNDPTNPTVIMQSDFGNDQYIMTINNLGTQTTTYGVAADLGAAGDVQPLWDSSWGGLADSAQVTLGPGESTTQSVPSWPGTMVEFFSNIDTPSQTLIGKYNTPGVHVPITFDANGPIAIGLPITWSPDPVDPGAGLAVTATGVTAGPVEAYLDPSPNFGWDDAGINLVETPGSPLADLGSGTVAADGTLTLDGVVPPGTPPGSYSIDLRGTSGFYVAFGDSQVDVDSGTPDSVVQGTAVITGKAKVNGTLSVDAEGWSAPGLQLQYQWSANGVRIDGATSPTFVPTNAQLGTAITVTVTGWAAGEAPSAPATSVPLNMPTGNAFAATPSPTISGTVAVGQKLTAGVADWTPSSGFSYQWDVNGLQVGTDSKTYTLAPADLGDTVTVTITSTKAGYSPVAEQSDPTATVGIGQIQPPANSNRPSIGGQEKVAGTVTLKMGNWTPTPTFGIQWFIGTVPVPGATGTSLTIPGLLNGVSTIGSQISAQIIASSPGYQDYPDTASDATAITKAAKSS